MATVASDSHVTLTAEGAVSVSYNTLVSAPLSLTSSIGKQRSLAQSTTRTTPLTLPFNAEKAFGSHPDSLGIIIVRDLPDTYAPARERLLRLAYRFATLDVKIREQYADPKSRYRCVAHM